MAKHLSSHAVELLAVISDNCGDDGSFWVPPSGLKTCWCQRMHDTVYVSGNTSAAALKSLERRGLIQFMPLADYASKITEEGQRLVAEYDANGWPHTGFKS